VSFPGDGPFGITSLSPATVDTVGGTLVTITGTALPLSPRVRVGDSAAATVVSSSTTSIVFRAPARVAGVYDVHVFAVDSRHDSLEAALTYADGAGSGGSGTGDGTGGSGDSGSGSGGTGDGGSGTGGTGDGGSGDSGSGSGGSGDGGSGSGSDGDSGSAEPVVTTGPAGQRLVRSAKFDGLGSSFWATDCSTSCSGTAI
jgi:hypothetical protein